MRIIVINRQNKVNLDLNLFKKVSTYISEKFDKDKNTELNIVFVEKNEIKVLNKKYRSKNIPTDVLSFSYNKNDEAFTKEHGLSIIGEIIISPEVASENIKENKNKIEDFWNINYEIVLLIIHGLLHVYDYDHEIKEDRIKMDRIQSSLLNDVENLFSL
jgi:probable rRNA maturation factor